MTLVSSSPHDAFQHFLKRFPSAEKLHLNGDSPQWYIADPVFLHFYQIFLRADDELRARRDRGGA